MNRGKRKAETLEAPAEAPAEAPRPSERGIISKASIRRLVHDAGARLSKEGYAEALRELEDYVQAVVSLAISAMEFSRRKSLSLAHVLYAAEAHGGSVPECLIRMESSDLHSLQKCNPRADASLRKKDLSHAEISEASFGKLARGAAARLRPALRITMPARRMLQLLAEYRVMHTFDRKGVLGVSTPSTTAKERSMQSIFGCQIEKACELEAALQRACERMPTLMTMSSSKTIDERLVRAALAPLGDWILTWTPAPDFAPTRECKLIDRVLRGRMPDKRVTHSASWFVACAFRRLLA